MKKKDILFKALRCAFPYTLPILAGFWFLGFAYGYLMNVSGFSFVYPLVMSICIFGGSLEYVAVSMLLSSFAPLQTVVMALMIQARHIFYGISMLDKYRGMGWKKFYLIYGMCDESFSINFTADIPEDVDRGWFYFFVNLLDQSYWVSGALLGFVFGDLVHFNTKGLDFIMTAMFVTIFAEQWMKEKRHFSELAGFVSGVAALVIFGPQGFMIPAMISILILLYVFRRPVEKIQDAKEGTE